ncbi:MULTISPECIES: hypothetical protein [Mycobacterium]|uniref:Uncharacterized protein n=1 Tax=Mycobacterium europaeum TaxID=761804 RepID=A0A0U1CXH5_9MYCO|nr:MULTISPECIES: hypothetical protein [Mycobacterium]MCV7395437.1 hypothetical protein [Mycobacterium paraseoulense]CQD02773.1 hypothetical protein BN000_00358 [Mycobacterium europaeum]
MITFDNPATSTAGKPRRPDIEVRIEGVRRRDGALRLGIMLDGRMAT